MSSTTPVKFDIYAGDQLIRTEILTGPVIKVGKVTTSTLRLDDDSVSRMHAQIELTSPDDVVLLDLGSERGTAVNGQRVTRARLSTGDLITFGEVRVAVTIVGQTLAQSAAPEERAPVSAPQAPQVSFEEQDEGYGHLLEVLSLYGHAVIDVTHIKEEGAYYIGYSEEADCFIPEGHVPVEPFPLAVMTPDGSHIVHIPDHVSGEVMLDGVIYNIQDLRQQRRLQKSQVPNTHTLRLPFKARCRISLGDFTFLVNAVANIKPAPTLAPYQQIDPRFIFSVVSTGAFMALVLLLISLIPESPESLALARLNSLEKFVTITLEADEQLEKKKKEKNSGAKGAKRAEKAEGKMGRRDAEQQDKKFQVKGTETGDASVISGRKQQLAQNTVNEIFSSFDSGLLDGTQSAVALGALEGFVGNQSGATAGASFGMGGLGGVGTGMGGGGDSATSFGLGGLSTVGGGGGNGRGNGYGSGVGDVGTKKRTRRPKVITLSPIDDSGNLPKAVIKRVVLTRKGAYQNCYERQLQAKRDLNGTISVAVMVSGTNGKVLLARVVRTSMNNTAVENCLVGQIKKLSFPAPKNGKTVKFTYPFRFKPS